MIQPKNVPRMQNVYDMFVQLYDIAKIVLFKTRNLTGKN